MTDLSSLPKVVRSVFDRYDGMCADNGYIEVHLEKDDYSTLRDYVLAVTAERDGLAKRIEDAPVAKVKAKVGELAWVCVSHELSGHSVALVKVG